MINIKCDLVFFDECTELNIPSNELYGGQNASLIHFNVYTYQGVCATHGIITNGPSLCR